MADNYRFQDTLAASYAETGDFEQAVKWQEQTSLILWFFQLYGIVIL